MSLSNKPYYNINYPAPMDVWEPETEYDAGLDQTVVPTDWNGRSYECRRSGKTGTVEPVWPLDRLDEVVDGEVTWRCYTGSGHVQYLPGDTNRSSRRWRVYTARPYINPPDHDGKFKLQSGDNAIAAWEYPVMNYNGIFTYTSFITDPEGFHLKADEELYYNVTARSNAEPDEGYQNTSHIDVQALESIILDPLSLSYGDAPTGRSIFKMDMKEGPSRGIALHNRYQCLEDTYGLRFDVTFTVGPDTEFAIDITNWLIVQVEGNRTPYPYYENDLLIRG